VTAHAMRVRWMSPSCGFFTVFANVTKGKAILPASCCRRLRAELPPFAKVRAHKSLDWFYEGLGEWDGDSAFGIGAE